MAGKSRKRQESLRANLTSTGPAGNLPTEPTFMKENLIMLRLAIVFLVIALIAAFLGFGGVAALSWEGAKILFVVFIILAVLSFLGHGFRRRSFWG
jgi:uncharacterized membrane protein YtjA (UPF0391 family)